MLTVKLGNVDGLYLWFMVMVYGLYQCKYTYIYFAAANSVCTSEDNGKST